MLITVLCIFISASAFFFAIYQFSGIRKLYNNTAHIPGPSTLPLIGNGLHFLGSAEYALQKFSEAVRNYGSPTRLALGPKIYLIITNPKQINTVLNSKVTAEKEKVYEFFSLAVSKGLLTSEHKLWRVHRKLLQPTFASHILRSFVTIFQNNALSLTRTVENKIGSSEFEISPHILPIVFSNICESAMGVSLETKSHKVIQEFLKTVDRGIELFFERLVKVWLHVETIFKFSQTAKKLHKCIKYLQNFTEDVIQDKRRIMQKIALNNKVSDSSTKKIKTTLEMMLELTNEEKFSDEELRDHTLTFIIAAYDTSLRSLDFLFLMLASHPDIQDRVYEEIFNIYGDEDPEYCPVKYEDLSNLIYLERVIKENLRLFPPVTLIARQVSEDFELDGCFIPKNCGIAISIINVHRDEKLWPNPLKFDPDRFLPESVSQRHPCSFIPFSYGSRDCIGRTYAIMSMKIIVATFLRKYIVKKDKILPVKDIKIQMDAFILAVDPIKIRIEKREKSK